MHSRQTLLEARTHLEIAVAQSPRNRRYLLLLGEAELAAGDALAAISRFEAALSLAPDPRTYYELAFACLHGGRAADVDAILDAAEADGMGSPRAVYVRGLTRFREGHVIEAAERLDEVIDFGCDTAFYRLELARILISGAFSRPAFSRRPLFDRALASVLEVPLTSRRAAERAYLGGVILIERGEPQRAADLLDGGAYPDAAEGAFRFGVAAARAGRTSVATTAFRRAEIGDLRTEAGEWLSALAGYGGPLPSAVHAPACRPVGLGSLLAPELVAWIVRTPMTAGSAAARDDVAEEPEPGEFGSHTMMDVAGIVDDGGEAS